MRYKSLYAMAMLAAVAWAGSGGGAAQGRRGPAAARFQLISKQSRSYTATRMFPGLSSGLRVNRATNRITASAAGNYVITALAGPSSDMMSFEIAGLKNPEIRIPQGTRLTLAVINVDDDMAHNLALTTAAPPYPKQVGSMPIGSATLKPHKGRAYSASLLTVRATGVGPGFYLCTVPGHARSGMYGRIAVLP